MDISNNVNTVDLQCAVTKYILIRHQTTRSYYTYELQFVYDGNSMADGITSFATYNIGDVISCYYNSVTIKLSESMPDYPYVLLVGICIWSCIVVLQIGCIISHC